MKVLLKNRDADLFIRKDGQWSPDECDATDFKTPVAAINFCQLNHLSNTSLIVCDNECRYEMPLRWDD